MIALFGIHVSNLPLADLKGHIELDLSQAEKMTGLFTENSVVLVEGEVSRDEQKFHVKALAYPPSQPRSKALALHPQLNLAARSVPVRTAWRSIDDTNQFWQRALLTRG